MRDSESQFPYRPCHESPSTRTPQAHHINTVPPQPAKPQVRPHESYRENINFKTPI